MLGHEEGRVFYFGPSAIWRDGDETAAGMKGSRMWSSCSPPTSYHLLFKSQKAGVLGRHLSRGLGIGIHIQGVFVQGECV